jgi:hypothetical protein
METSYRLSEGLLGDNFLFGFNEEAELHAVIEILGLGESDIEDSDNSIFKWNNKIEKGAFVQVSFSLLLLEIKSQKKSTLKTAKDKVVSQLKEAGWEEK